jgi:hypothetical protein
MEYEDAIDSLGESHKVDNSSYPTLVSSTDRKLRETAYFSYMKSYENLNKTLAEIFIKDLKKQGGKYQTISKQIKRIDEVNKIIFFLDKTSIKIEDIIDIKSITIDSIFIDF